VEAVLEEHGQGRCDELAAGALLALRLRQAGHLDTPCIFIRDVSIRLREPDVNRQ